MDDITVLPRVNARHPDVSDDDVRCAWLNPVRSRRRNDTEPTQYVTVGIDGHGRFLEMCAVLSADSKGWVVYHAMKATRKVLHEVGLI